MELPHRLGAKLFNITSVTAVLLSVVLRSALECRIEDLYKQFAHEDPPDVTTNRQNIDT